MPNTRTYSQYTAEALVLLGHTIRIERKARRWTAADLAERVGVSLVTLRRIENGDPSCSIGLVFEAAALVGVSLFESDRTSLAANLHKAIDKLTLLPQRIRKSSGDVDDDF